MINKHFLQIWFQTQVLKYRESLLSHKMRKKYYQMVNLQVLLVNRTTPRKRVRKKAQIHKKDNKEVSNNHRYLSSWRKN